MNERDQIDAAVLAMPARLLKSFTRRLAERLGISPKTVEWRMTKALAHCAAQLR